MKTFHPDTSKRIDEFYQQTSDEFYQQTFDGCRGKIEVTLNSEDPRGIRKFIDIWGIIRVSNGMVLFKPDNPDQNKKLRIGVPTEWIGTHPTLTINVLYERTDSGAQETIYTMWDEPVAVGIDSIDVVWEIAEDLIKFVDYSKFSISEPSTFYSNWLRKLKNENKTP